jgi:hypothetical protein
MQAVPRYDIRLTAQDTRRLFLDLHQAEHTQLTLFIVKEQINIRVFTRFPARG